jgi:hypothetical protein
MICCARSKYMFDYIETKPETIADNQLLCKLYKHFK